MNSASGTPPEPSQGGFRQADDPELAQLSKHDLQLLLEIERMHHQDSSTANQAEKDLIQRTLQALTLAGLGLYGAIRFGQQLYCDGLGITPEEIGMTYTASISRAAVILIALAAPLVFFVGLLVLNSIIEGTNRFSTIVEWVIFYLSFLAAIAVIAAANAVLKLPFGFEAVFWTSIVLGLTVGLVLWMVEWAKRRANGTRRPFFRIKQDPTAQVLYSHRSRIVFPVLIAMVIIAAFLMAGFTAQRQVENVKTGNPIGRGRGLGVLGVRADPVRIIGTIPNELRIANRRLIYLGHADGKLVVFDVECAQPLRLQDDGLSIEILSALPAGTSDCQSDSAR